MLNIPNTLSCIRLVMVPMFAVLFFNDPTEGHWWAAGVYALATATDALDGMLARRLNQITRLGRILDPLADKLMGFTALLCIAISEGMPLLWAATAVFFVKELLMAIGALVQFRKIDDVPPSGFIGKFATAFFFVTCFCIMVIPPMPDWLKETLVSAATVLTVSAFAFYAARFVKLTQKEEREKK